MTKNNLLISFLMLLLLLAGCRPHNVLSSGKMIDVLYDLHKAEGVVNLLGLVWTSDSTDGLYYNSVLEKHHITQSQLDSSLVWYTDHPQLFDKIYPHVMRRIEAEQTLLAERVQQQGTVMQTIQTPQREIPTVEQIMDKTLHGLQPMLLRQSYEE